MKPILITLIALLFSSCANSDEYNQFYKTFKNYKEANARNKSWFPDLIQKDAFNIQSQSRLSKLSSFSKFGIKNTKQYEELLDSNQYTKLHKIEFIKKSEAFKSIRPNWFPKTDSIITFSQEMFFKKERTCILLNKKDKVILAITSN
jgi:hypothetical protein|tara:strand:+ start:72 stop:512 length:441 start_codon:yes stop_codon:yes gene_type:complete